MTARLRDIGRELHSRVRSFFDHPVERTSTPLELLQAALDELERKVQPSGRGRRVFPYNRIVVRIAQPGADRHAIEAVFRQLETRLRERLAEVKCDAPASIVTRIIVAAREEGSDAVLTIECSNVAQSAPAPPEAAAPPTLRLAVVKGQCEQAEYAFTEPVIAVGRTVDPIDAQGNLRRNHVAFLEARDGVTETVARAHAQFRLDAETGSYHLFNESSSNPTSIVRGGRIIRVPPRDPRGLRLQSGDEVQLGRAVIRVTIA